MQVLAEREKRHGSTIVDVYVLIPPDGRIGFALADETTPGEMMDRWRASVTAEKALKYGRLSRTPTMVRTQMFMSDYISIGASNTHWISG